MPWPICRRATRVTPSMPSASSAPCGTVDLGGEALRAVAAGRDHRRSGHQHPRAGDDAVVDRLLQPDVGVAGALGAEVAHRRDAGHQRVARAHRRARHAIGDRLAQHLIVPGRLVVGVQQQVRVALDQARQQRQPGQGDGARRRRAAATSAAGPAATISRPCTSTHPALVHRLAVEDPRRLQQPRRGRRCRGLGSERRGERAQRSGNGPGTETAGSGGRHGRTRIARWYDPVRCGRRMS